MDSLSQERLREIYNENGGDPEKIAAALGISASELAAAVTPPPVPAFRRRTPPADIGKDYFRQHIVSVKHADWQYWPEDDDAKIAAAREKYEAGTHDICQGRDRNWFVLYCIPLKKRVGARKFFRTIDE